MREASLRQVAIVEVHEYDSVAGERCAVPVRHIGRPTRSVEVDEDWHFPRLLRRPDVQAQTVFAATRHQRRINQDARRQSLRCFRHASDIELRARRTKPVSGALTLPLQSRLWRGPTKVADGWRGERNVLEDSNAVLTSAGEYAGLDFDCEVVSGSSRSERAERKQKRPDEEYPSQIAGGLTHTCPPQGNTRGGADSL